MQFSTNFGATDTFLLPAGRYEAIIERWTNFFTRNGAEGLAFHMVIRNDIGEQEYQNQRIIYNIWKKKVPTTEDSQVDGYSFVQLMLLAKACNLQNGKNYNCLEDMLDEVNFKCVSITVTHEEYKGKVSATVNYVNKTGVPECNHVFEKAVAEATVAEATVAEATVVAPTSNVPTTTCQSMETSNFEELMDEDDLPF